MRRALWTLAARWLVALADTPPGKNFHAIMQEKIWASRAAARGFRLIKCAPDRFAFVQTSDEIQRYPLAGSFTPAEVDGFLHLRERGK